MTGFAADFANSWNLDLIEEQYQRWHHDRSSVSKDWQLFFAGMELGLERDTGTADGNGKHGGKRRQPSRSGRKHKPGRTAQQRADQLIYAYRDLGHSVCKLDPLDANNLDYNPQLDMQIFGLSEDDLELEFVTANIPGLGHKTPLRELLNFLRETYCGTIGVEYMHITDPERRHWLRDQVESRRNRPQLELDDKRRILIKLCQAQLLEKFIHTKFFGQKRFSLEGSEALIPALDSLIELAPELAVREVVLGMSHRGRLNVLCNIMDKSFEGVFTEFEENWDPSQFEGNGDVKYHLGYSNDHVTAKGRKIHLTLTANPSHLEAVDPVVLGRSRAKQRQYGDTDKRESVVPVLIHGDAAIAGQGLVMETFQFSQLEGYSTGGTVHIVVNNQIGFTTLPHDARSTRYCTDIAKMVEAPVFHVNADDVEGVVHCVRLALRYRQQFRRDAVIDLVCYRRFGHNETDEPNYTQPTMYSKIQKHPPVADHYKQTLLDRGDLEQDEVECIETIMHNQLQDALDQVKNKPQAPRQRSTFQGVWTGLHNRYSHAPVETGVPAERLNAIGEALSTWPKGFKIHPTIKRLASRRSKTLKSGDAIDWAFAEMLAFGSLLTEGIPVRLSGQDSRRGTFSQRHSYWYDLDTRKRYAPLNHVAEEQARFCVYNSPLSEAGVLGFDYGYSLSEPNMLIIWEAQFGDFGNGAQVIIDQFIASSEAKWGRVSGITLFLPHGQEGAGPEHSSARLERFLQLCAEDNIQVAYCSTAAQHFHILRRQMHRDFRKPLVLMTPKGHLRSKSSSSPIDELMHGRFHEVLGDPDAPGGKRLALCTGKIAHELRELREEHGVDDLAIIRIEQLHPFPEEQLQQALEQHREFDEVMWCQEEPENAGAWHYIEPRLRRLFQRDIRYVGREAASVTAPGSATSFRYEQKQLLGETLGIDLLAKHEHAEAEKASA